MIHLRLVLLQIGCYKLLSKEVSIFMLFQGTLAYVHILCFFLILRKLDSLRHDVRTELPIKTNILISFAAKI